ncbi:histidine phosphatase family protein [Saccharibacillus kuerlensis]|uniref:Phosphatase n=1 Tax=Saccharibacillus kuerlensis TaxID=459527 RepID=A0ABQ2L8A4_9BACL|nr:histidine phosphatase family protein [Saccharibacillus kuerlensis]GGO06518.1 phosphatase [Saccharibacillus kuerlensis]
MEYNREYNQRLDKERSYAGESEEGRRSAARAKRSRPADGKAPVTTLYLTRHGQTLWNQEGRLQGRMDSPLTEKGELHARWLAESLADKPLDVIYSSSSPRAVRTAEILRGGRMIEIRTDDELREIHLGGWEGQRADEIRAAEPDAYDTFWSRPHLYEPADNGESFVQLGNRVVPAIERILNENHGRSVLVVTHAASLNLLMTAFRQRPISEIWQPPVLESTSLCKIVYDADGMRVELHGDTSHYRE